ncbi:retrovirus-related pol polyprotein from transposon TNT 1-94 [Tanacetum coccineum]|uniref:Retrovirus-related pol polyprotein from transposon TNT 1-94 n=1 Tax=Tanacetum coccineum TaxID=301880 RepID=A0ABQ5F5H8_9ASTR
MIKTSNEQGFTSVVYEGKTHEDLRTYLFACFLSQEEPKKDKKGERGIMIRNKARLVTQGYTQEEGIDYYEVFALVARIEAIRLKRKFMAVNLQGLKIQSSLTEFIGIDQGLGSTSGIRAYALRNFDLEVMELENTQNNALAKLPMLKLREYEMWEIKIK